MGTTQSTFRPPIIRPPIIRPPAITLPQIRSPTTAQRIESFTPTGIQNSFDYYGGIAIKDPTNGRYLIQNDDGTLTFTGLRLISEFNSALNRQLDRGKFTLTRVGASVNNRFKIQSHGIVIGSATDNQLYWKDTGVASSTGMNKLKADGTSANASVVELSYNASNSTSGSATTLGEYKFNIVLNTTILATNVIIEHYLPAYIKTIDGDYGTLGSYDRIKSATTDNCRHGTGNSNRISQMRVGNILQCAQRCNESSDCNHYTYNYLKPSGNNCSLYKDCTGTNLDIAYSPASHDDRVIIMNKSTINSQQASANREAQQFIDNRMDTYEDSMRLMNDNLDMMEQINQKVNEINNLEIRDKNNAYNQVMPHQSIMNSINSPENLATLRQNIHNYVKKSKILSMQRELNELEQANVRRSRVPRPTQPEENEIKSIQNIESSKMMNVYLPDDIPKNDTNNHEYMIFGNGKCLSYDKNTNNISEYKFVDCNRRDDKQLFKIGKVDSVITYNNKIANPYNEIKSDKFDSLGFYYVSPKDYAKECMTLNDNGLTIQPCDLDSNQRYHVSKNIASC